MNTYEVIPVKNAHDIVAEVPGSKSITNRALLLAAMSEGTTELQGILFSEDSRVFIKALQSLGFSLTVSEENKSAEITGCGGRIPLEKGEVYVGSAGTAARFLTAFLGLSGGCYRMDASEQMKKRPMSSLLQALEALGCRFEFENEPYHFPFTITGCRTACGEVTVSIEQSSQFLSALLICAPLLPKPFTIKIEGSHGMDYVVMTLKMMAAFGGPAYELFENEIRIVRPCAYKIAQYAIEPDLSAACYFYGAGALLGQKAKVLGVHSDSMQGDLKFLDVLQQMGCERREEEDGILMLPPAEGLKGGSFDLSSFSDQALTLAALSSFADSPVTIRGVGHIRLQECDRIHAILKNLSEIGTGAREEDGDITIYPSFPHGGRIETFEDHRVAMSFSLPGLLTSGIVIENPGCCKKTFENYFEALEKYVY